MFKRKGTDMGLTFLLIQTVIVFIVSVIFYNKPHYLNFLSAHNIFRFAVRLNL